MVQKAREFIFSEYSETFDEKEVAHFTYAVILLDGSEELFKETISLPEKVKINLDKDPDQLKTILQNLHLILGISYWKAYCPKEITIKNYSLSKEQAEFWNTVYTKGLGEFFCTNQIDYRGLIRFPFDTTAQKQPSRLKLLPEQDKTLQKRILIGIGGGKDSILVAQMLKEKGIEFETCYLSNPLKEAVAKIFSPHPLEVKRELDSKLLELAKSGIVHNGHIPVSAVYAFILLLLGFLYDYDYLIVGNERSSNYGNVEYLNEVINHQWSKSHEFENLFRDYIKNFISPDIKFFSLMRPFYEIEIVRRFCQYPQYFGLFSSCNRNFRITDPLRDKKWCCECDKCAFVFCLMTAFLPKDKIIEIFRENLYEKSNMIDIYRQLLGIKDVKPFECVGTPEEVKVAFLKAHEGGEYNDDAVMKMFREEVLPTIENRKMLEKEVFSYGDDSNIPYQFKAAFPERKAEG